MIERLAVVASHPIQYQAPLFRALAERVDLHVYFAHRQMPEQQGEAGFGVSFDWDTDLLSGYEHSFLDNRARRPGTQRYAGCDTPQIAASLTRGRFGAVLTMGWYLKSYVQALVAGRRLGLRSMVRGDSTLASRRGPLVGLVKRLLYPALFRRIDAFLVVGQRSRAYLEAFGVGAERMFWSPHAVDNAWFASAADAARPGRSAVRESLGVGADERMVLFVGKLLPGKRPLDVVLALARLRERGIPARGVFVGGGMLRDEIEEIAGQLGVPVTMAGFRNQTQLPAVYAAAEVLVLSSDQETWGLVVNEAMACGVPAVVSSAAGCADDLVDAGRTGEVYRCGDVEALADAIARILPVASSGPVKAALANKMSEYSLDRSVDGIVDAIRNAGTR